MSWKAYVRLVVQAAAAKQIHPLLRVVLSGRTDSKAVGVVTDLPWNGLRLSGEELEGRHRRSPARRPYCLTSPSSEAPSAGARHDDREWRPRRPRLGSPEGAWVRLAVVVNRHAPIDAQSTGADLRLVKACVDSHAELPSLMEVPRST